MTAGPPAGPWLWACGLAAAGLIAWLARPPRASAGVRHALWAGVSALVAVGQFGLPLADGEPGDRRGGQWLAVAAAAAAAKAAFDGRSRAARWLWGAAAGVLLWRLGWAPSLGPVVAACCATAAAVVGRTDPDDDGGKER